MSIHKITDGQLPLPELPDKKRTPWRSIGVCGTVSLCQAIQFSLYFSSLWPYLQLLDPSITESFYGYIMAAYSLGQISAAPLVGMWATKIKSIVRPSQCSLMCVFVGNAIYFLAALSPSSRKWFVLVGRFMVGLGAGNMSMMQTYAATASLPKERSQAIAIVTGGVSLGMCLGPGLQLLFTPLGYPGIHIYSTLRINMYTAPPFTCCFINIIAILILQFWFEEKYAGLANDRKQSKADRVYVPPYDNVAVFLCHWTRFTQLFTWTNLETVGAPLAMAMFAISREQAVTYFASSHLALGALSFFIYLLFIVVKMDKICDFRKICISGIMGFVLFHIVTFSWPFLPGKVYTYSSEEYEQYLNGNVTIEPVGCPVDRFAWCNSLTPINIWVFFIMFIITVGGFWSEINISLGTILSNVLGPRQQANQQSMFYTSGAMARLTGPVIISTLYTNFGPRVAWIIEVLILLFTISLWFIFYKRMVPLVPANLDKKEPNEKTKNEVEIKGEARNVY